METPSENETNAKQSAHATHDSHWSSLEQSLTINVPLIWKVREIIIS
jgi:hypothetical protein